MHKPFTQFNYQRIIWHSRRGMLELDLLLAPFVREQFLSLEATLQTGYIELLEQEDCQLYKWLALGQQPETRFVDIINRIRQHASQSAP